MSTDEQVRRRLQEILTRSGVDEGRVALEVLYWLPEEFIKDYIQLFQKALSLGDENHGAGEEAKAGKAKVSSKRRGKPKSMAAQGGGKKYYKGEWVVKDDNAFEVKRRVDRKLRRVVNDTMRAVRAEEHAKKADQISVEVHKKMAKVREETTKLVEESQGVQDKVMDVYGGYPMDGSQGSRGGLEKRGELVERKMGKAIQKVCRDCGKINARQSSTCRYCND